MNTIKFSNIEEQDLFKVRIPNETQYYKPVSHKNIIEAIKEELDKNNLYISNTSYKSNSDGEQLIGMYDIKQEGYSELGMRIAFRNSYNKTMSVAITSGSNVWICSNGMVSGEQKFIKKHMGSVSTDLNLNIVKSIETLGDTFILHNKHKEVMKNIEVDKSLYAKLAGQLYVEHDIITSRQLGIIKDEILNPTYKEFTEDNLWSFYNNVTHSLKTSHSLDYINRHIQLHNFVETEFSL